MVESERNNSYITLASSLAVSHILLNVRNEKVNHSGRIVSNCKSVSLETLAQSLIRIVCPEGKEVVILIIWPVLLWLVRVLGIICGICCGLTREIYCLIGHELLSICNTSCKWSRLSVVSINSESLFLKISLALWNEEISVSLGNGTSGIALETDTLVLSELGVVL